MSPLKTVIVSGAVNKLSYPLGSTEKIFDGTWEMALSSISFIFKKEIPPTIVKIGTNFVTHLEINSTGEIIRQPACLNMIFISGSANKKNLIGFKQRDFFEINEMQQELKVFLSNAESSKSLEGIEAYVHILLKRKR